MRTFLLVLALLAFGLAAATARANGPTHFKESFSGTFSIPAGELCDFTYAEEFSGVDNVTIFGDPDNPDRVIIEENLYVKHINVDTGDFVDEYDHLVFQFNAADATFKQIGLFWHLRDPSGKIVVVQAALAVFNTDTGELIKITPGLNPDFGAVICPALGGSPAL
ncbi:MAG TPA: hypothetical protein VGR43_09840 [Dehalococcoidia bacterium]|jgi:hypothetical protein|nr:hypothetical protein [Dehalococcoidia bacterium]